MKIFKLKEKNGRIRVYIGKIKIFSYRCSLTYDILKKNNIMLSALQKKSSMIDNIWRNKNTLFYVPNYPLDYVQNIIVESENYYEIEILKELSNYLCENAIIFDIGANIGNHTLFFGIEKKAAKIHAFEPIPQTFSILKKNIELNNLSDIVLAYNVALSNEDSKASIKSFMMSDCGSTQLCKNTNGDINTVTLDLMKFENLERVDFVKIDTEGYEFFILQGAKEFLTKYRPIIFIEIFDENRQKVDQLLSELKYNCIKKLGEDNYIYIYNYN